MTTLLERKEAFHRLHRSGCFVMPNPWDLGSARVLEQMGFPALATTSSGFAWTMGRSDGANSLEDALVHFEQIAQAVKIPVNGDFQGCFAVDPAGVEANVLAAAATGVTGLSIEDSTGDAAAPLFDFSLAVERVHAARAATRQGDAGVLLTARSEGFIVGAPDLDATIRRLAAFAEAGADCLYAPGLGTVEQIKAVVEAVAPKPVNVLVGGDFTTVAALAELGVRRISVGSALARTAWSGFLAAAEEIAEEGTFGRLADAAPFAPLDGRFARPTGEDAT